MAGNPFDTDNPFAAAASDNPFGTAAKGVLELESAKADLGRRFLGALIDGLLPALVAVPLALVAAMVTEFRSSSVEALYYGVYITSALPFALANWYLIVDRGQSLGKMAVGTRIVQVDGEPVDFVRGVIVRNWVVVAANMFCGLASVVDAVLIFGAERRCGHDYIANTIVIDAAAHDPYR